MSIHAQQNLVQDFEAWLKLTGRSIKPCNCGGPQYGTDHSPDCEWVLSADDMWDQFMDKEQ